MVIFETSASTAIASTLARSKPCALKWLRAASMMRRQRLGSRGLPRRGVGATSGSVLGMGLLFCT
jgi:hypothetical protein